MQGDGLWDATLSRLVPGAKRKPKPGEKHALLYTADGWQPAAYMGPGTHIVDNLRNNVEPLTQSDKVAMAHDIRYSLAPNEAAIRAADVKMINKLKSIRKKKEDYRVNTLMGQIPIQAKVWAGDLGLIKTSSFTNYGNLKGEDRALAEEKLKELEMQGFGIARPHTHVPYWIRNEIQTLSGFL